MKTSFFLLSALLCGPLASAQTTAAPEQQALARQLNQLMRDPAKPKQDVLLVLNGCHVQNIIRDRAADVQMTTPVAISYGRGQSGWAVNAENGYFELKMDFDWSDVTALSYGRSDDDDAKGFYEIRIRREKKNSNTTLELPLRTTDEALVKTLVSRLEQVRNRCSK